MKYFQVFGSKCYILNDRENLGKFDAKSDKGIFLGYSTSSRAYRVYNKRTKTVNSRVETRSMSRTTSPLTPLEVNPPISRNDEVSTSKKPLSRVVKNHLESNIIGSLDEGLCLRKGNKLLANHVTYHCYLAQFKPKKVEEALQDENWVEPMHEEMNQFVRE